MKTLYVHIGTPKTGTKSIQHFCKENRKILGKYGFSYPDTSSICPDLNTRRIRNGHFMAEKIEIDNKEEQARIVQEKYQAGMEIIKNKFLKFDNVILSDEAIYGATYKRRQTLWSDLARDGKEYGFTVKVIVYLRRQDKYLASLWNQHVKGNRMTNTWEEYISKMPEHRQLDYFKKLESIAEVLGEENIIVRRFGREYFPSGSIYADFLKAVGLELTEEYRIIKEERNQSLLGNAHEIMRIVNGIPNLQEVDREFMRDILRIDGEICNEHYPTSMFSKCECRKIMGQFKQSNRRVAEKYLGEKGADLFDDTIPDLPKWRADNPYMEQDVIRFAVIGMMQLRMENEKLREICMQKFKEPAIE